MSRVRISSPAPRHARWPLREHSLGVILFGYFPIKLGPNADGCKLRFYWLKCRSSHCFGFVVECLLEQLSWPGVAYPGRKTNRGRWEDPLEGGVFIKGDKHSSYVPMNKVRWDRQSSCIPGERWAITFSLDKHWRHWDRPKASSFTAAQLQLSKEPRSGEALGLYLIIQRSYKANWVDLAND